MVVDPEFSDVGKDKSRTGRPWRRWLLVYPVLAFAGCHTLWIGSPVHRWYIERLEHSAVVQEVADESLILADGRSVPLPFIKRLPRTDPVFLKALGRGVEVGQDGEVIGLITVYPYCGNDPYRSYTYRINLSDLAGYMNPAGIDRSIVPAEAIDDLMENEPRSLDPHVLRQSLMAKADMIRGLYEAYRNAPSEQQQVIRSYSQERIDR